MTIICFPPAVGDTILQLQRVPLCPQAPGCLTGSFYLPESRLAGLVLLPSQYLLQVRIGCLTGWQVGHCPTGYPGTGAAAYCIGLGYLVSVLSNHQVVSRKHVSILVFLSWSVFNLVIVLGQQLEPPGHLSLGFLKALKPLQCIVVCSDSKQSSIQVMAEVSDCVNHSKHLFLGSAVSTLVIVQHTTCIRDYSLTPVLLLGKNCSGHIGRGRPLLRSSA